MKDKENHFPRVIGTDFLVDLISKLRSFTD